MNLNVICNIMNKLCKGNANQKLTINTQARLFLAEKQNIEIEDGFLYIEDNTGDITEKICIPFDKIEYIGTC